MNVTERENLWSKKLFELFLGVFLFLLPWQTIWITQEQFLNGVKWQYGTVGFFATEILLWLCIGTWMVWYCQQRKLAFKNWRENFSWTRERKFLASIVCLLGYCYLSIGWSFDKSVALQTSLHFLEACLLFIVIIASPISWEKIFKWFVAGSIIQSILGIWQFLAQSTFSFKWLGLVAHPVMEPGTSVIVGEGVGRVMRAYGAFSHPNVFGGYLVIAIIVTSLFLYAHTQKNQIQKKFSMYFIFFIGFLLQNIALFFTLSRSAWLAAAIWFLGYGLFLIRQKCWSLLKSMILLFFILILPLVFVYLPLVQNRAIPQSSHELQSVNERVSGIHEGIQIAKSFPWLGVGVGNYTAAAYQIDPHRPGYEYQPVHTIALLFLAELGIVGYIFVFGVLWFLIKSYFVGSNKTSKYIQCVFFLALLPLFALDHYLYSSYIGLVIFGVGAAAILRFSPVYPEQKELSRVQSSSK